MLPHLGPVGDPVLGPVEDVVVAIEDSSRCGSTSVGTISRLAQCKTALRRFSWSLPIIFSGKIAFSSSTKRT